MNQKATIKLTLQGKPNSAMRYLIIGDQLFHLALPAAWESQQNNSLLIARLACLVWPIGIGFLALKAFGAAKIREEIKRLLPNVKKVVPSDASVEQPTGSLTYTLSVAAGKHSVTAVTVFGKISGSDVTSLFTDGFIKSPVSIAIDTTGRDTIELWGLPITPFFRTSI